MLVLDLGGQYSQLIARRVRECRVYSELVPHTHLARRRCAHGTRSRSSSPAGRRRSTPRARRRSIRGSSSSAIPTLGICYGMQLMAQDLGGRVERTGVSEFGKTELTRRGRRALRQPAGGADRLDEPPRLGDGAADGRARRRVVAVDADRRLRGSGAPALRRPVPPGGRAHALRQRPPEELPLLRSPTRPPTWTAAAVIEEQVERIRAQVGSRAGPLRALGRRRLGGRGAARLQGDRRPAHVRLRRPRPAAQGRGACRSSRRSATTSTSRSSTSTPEERFLAQARRRHRPGGEAARDRRGVHPRLRGRRPSSSARRRLPRPGHALLGRDRVRRRRRAWRRRSSRTTTSAACPRTSTSSSSSRCGCCSRTRCGASARSSACPSGWSGASRSRARASRSGSSAR